MLRAMEMQGGQWGDFNGCCCRGWKCSPPNCSRLPSLRHYDTILTSATCPAGGGRLRQHGVVSAVGIRIRIGTSPFSGVSCRTPVHDIASTSPLGSGGDRWHIRAVHVDSVECQAGTESETGFDFNVAVLMAGFAFESYNSPKVSFEEISKQVISDQEKVGCTADAVMVP